MEQDLTLFQAKLLSEQTLTADIALLTFEYPNTNTPFTYQAGQYIHMLLPDGRFAPLSIANAPHHFTLEFHLRHGQDIKQHLLANEILNTIRENQSITFTGPYGRCVLQNKPVQIFLAGGTGFAPMQALLEALTLQEQEKNKTIYLYWGVKKPEDCYALDYITSLKKILPGFVFIPVLSEPKAAQTNPIINTTGLVHEVFMQDFLKNFNQKCNINNTTIYASGPYPMIMALKQAFIAHHVPLSMLYSDMLPG